MFSLMIGPPGGGKSYESVVFHVLPTLEQGRKVITNLPINMDEIAKIEPRARLLLELRHTSRDPACKVPFASIHDYGDPWRHPDTNVGPLYVIDEFHEASPRRGLSPIDPKLPEDEARRLQPHHFAAWMGMQIDQWYAKHRHEGADVIGMTQSYGKVSKSITDLCQVCYRVKKMTAFGDSSGYIRKVQDGVRGDVLSVAERVYEPKFFPLYKSHTLTQAAVIEADAKDISPTFLKFKRAAYAISGLGLAMLIGTAIYTFTGDDASASPAPAVKARGVGEGGSARTKEHAAAALDVAPAPTAPRRQEPSLRLVAVMQLPNNPHAVVYDGRNERRIPLYQCGNGQYTGWVCNIDGQDVTFTTGPQPKSEGLGFMTAIAGGISPPGS